MPPFPSHFLPHLHQPLHLLRPTESTNCQSSATKYLREGNLTWQDEFDGIEVYGASDGVMGLEYWWQHEEVLYYSRYMSLTNL